MTLRNRPVIVGTEFGYDKTSGMIVISMGQMRISSVQGGSVIHLVHLIYASAPLISPLQGPASDDGMQQIADNDIV